MIVKSLTVAAFILGLGVVAGCDDPEVQSKVTEVMEHGFVTAELDCSIYAPIDFHGTHPNRIYFTARKMLDGSCFAQFCAGTVPSETNGAPSTCQSQYTARSSGGLTCNAYIQTDIATDMHSSGKPFRPLVDGYYASVEDGVLEVEARDYFFTHGSSSCNAGLGSCTDPEPWLSYDITDADCTGRNLEAFGATP